MSLRRKLLVYALALVMMVLSARADLLYANSDDNGAVDEDVKYPSKALMIDKTKGGRKEYDTASLTLDGMNINSDVPAILYKVGTETRTLVPIRVISEQLGGEVKWEDEEKIVKIFYKGMIVQLKIDDTNALINGVSTPLPSKVPAKLMSYIDIQRTYVPVRFISEAFGAKVDWDNEKRVVMISRKKKLEETPARPSQTLVSVDINSSSSPKRVKLNFKEDVAQEIIDEYIPANSSNSKNRIVLDIKDTVMGLTELPEYNESDEQYRLSVNDTELNALRSSQYTKDPYTTRVVLDMNVGLGYEIKKEDRTLVIELSEASLSSILNRSGGSRTSQLKFGEIMSYEVIKPLEYAVLDFDSRLYGNYTLHQDENGFLTMDFAGDAFIYEAYSSQPNDEFIQDMKLSQLSDRLRLEVRCQPGVRAYLNPNTTATSLQEIVFEKPVNLLNPDGIIIGIDPGHGGPDPGAIGYLDGTGTSEVDVLNDYIPLIKSKLEERGYHVRLARDEDIDMSLEARTKYAELINARVFISVHANASSSPMATGIETFANSSVPESERLASCILEEMIAISGERNRGVKDYNLHITRESLMPATLVELGFVTSPADLKKLRDLNHLEKLAEGLVLGVERYFNE